jgi:hypothetical protein
MILVSCECIHDWVSVNDKASGNVVAPSSSQRTHISVAENGDLIVKHRELDVAVSLLVNSIQRPNLILAGIPVHLEVLFLVFLAEDFVKVDDDLFVCSALEGNRFALIVEA